MTDWFYPLSSRVSKINLLNKILLKQTNKQKTTVCLLASSDTSAFENMTLNDWMIAGVSQTFRASVWGTQSDCCSPLFQHMARTQASGEECGMKVCIISALPATYHEKVHLRRSFFLFQPAFFCVCAHTQLFFFLKTKRMKERKNYPCDTL